MTTTTRSALPPREGGLDLAAFARALSREAHLLREQLELTAPIDSASWDKTVKLWDARRIHLLRSPPGSRPPTRPDCAGASWRVAADP